MSADDWDIHGADTGSRDDAGWDDEDWPDEDDGESLTIICPSCKADIYEDAEQCPCCGEYVVRSSTVWEGRPAWWIALGVVGIIATIFALSAL